MPSGRLVQILLLASVGALTASAFELVSKKGAMSRFGAHVIGAVAALVFAFFRSGRAPGITLLEHLLTAPGLIFIAISAVTASILEEMLKRNPLFYFGAHLIGLLAAIVVVD